MSLANPEPSTFRKIFNLLMIFTGLVWAWTMGLMILMPWESTSGWQPDYRVVALCKEGEQQEGCTLKFGELAQARQEGRVVALTGMEAFGDSSDKEAWHAWKTAQGKTWQYEVTWSSWDFEEGVRYRVEGDNLILLEHRLVGVQLLNYAVGLALASLALLWFLKRRK